jgi:uncharacterized protein (DUF1501 family)
MMNRREFLKTTGASGLALAAPIAISTKAQADELSPVGQYFVFVHLSGGWEPTTFCNPKGNEIRADVGAAMGMASNQVRNSGSPVNKFPKSAIRKAVDIYIGSETISPNMSYAPYLGTFNQTAADDSIDDGTGNDGFTIAHVQRILAGSLVGNTLTAAAANVDWTVVDEATVRANADAILEGVAATIALNGIQADLVDRDLNVDLNNNTVPANLFRYDAFVCLHAGKMRLLNGVDNRTNSHDTGTRFADTGSMSMGYPDFSALYAAVHGPDRPLAWMTTGGGNDESAGLVARSAASDAGFFNILGNPRNNMVDFIESELDVAQDLRKNLQARTENLPLRQQLQSQLYLVRESGLEFAGVAADITAPTDPDQVIIRNLASGNGTREHLRIGTAGFATGMASSMQISLGGFDTHGNHDNSHFDRIRRVLEELHFLFKALEVYGIDDETTVVVGSDFGRTPWYNDGDGKDHWAVTSYMLFGNGVAGGTEVNATNALVEALDVSNSGSDLSVGGGVRMTAAHIHSELRKLANIHNTPEAAQFPIDAEDLNILG